MATPIQIETGLWNLQRFPTHYSGLRAEVPLIDDMATREKWKHNFSDELLDTLLLRRAMLFTRPSEDAPWEYQHDIDH